jgi:hypothetical protein
MIQGRLTSRSPGRHGFSPFRLTRALGAAPRLILLPKDLARQPTRRWESSTSHSIQDDKKSGHITAGPNESILFFDSELPFTVTTSND